jgi:hypothetical protein
MAVRIGKSPSSKGDANFWSIKDGETHDVTLLWNVDEIVSADQAALWDFNPAPIWVTCELDDPSIELGVKPGYRAFMPVQVNIDGTPVVKIWSMPISVHRSIEEIGMMEDGVLAGMIVRVKRSGAGMRTKYTVVASTKRNKSPLPAPTPEDVVKTLNPMDRDGIISMLEKTTGMSYSRLIEVCQKRAAAKAEEENGPKPKPRPEIETEEFN